MASDIDTLNIGSIRLKREYPVAEVESHRPADPSTDPENHPQTAAVARARIAKLPDNHPMTDPQLIPATPTADLITDRPTLAKQAQAEPAVIVSSGLPKAIRPLLAAVGIFAIVLMMFKAPVIFSQVNYALNKPQPTPAADVAAPAAAVVPAENTITIPKINVHAPVKYETSTKEADIQRSLQDGVVHYGSTTVPGQPGNAAIFGHSSNDWWEPGNYKFVFVLLDKLVAGDRFTIDYQSKRYTYEVTGSKIVEPTDVSVLNPTAGPTVSLITCTPPGTALRRLVVFARQVDPTPNQAVVAANPPAVQSTTAGNLPSSAPGFFEQMQQGWNGIVQGIASLFGGTPAKPTTDNPSGSQQLPAIK